MCRIFSVISFVINRITFIHTGQNCIPPCANFPAVNIFHKCFYIFIPECLFALIIGHNNIFLYKSTVNTTIISNHSLMYIPYNRLCFFEPNLQFFCLVISHQRRQCHCCNNSDYPESYQNFRERKSVLFHTPPKIYYIILLLIISII